MSIFLIRHGKPIGAINPRIGAAGFARWVRRYDASGLIPDSQPPISLRARLPQGLVLSSNLRRAIESAQRCLGRPPERTLAVLREMAIPRYRLPLGMGAYTWLIVNRALWYLGASGPFESYSAARERAGRAANELQCLNQEHGDLIVFGHVLMNRQIARHLISQGWQGDAKYCDYWGMMALTLNPDRSRAALRPSMAE